MATAREAQRCETRRRIVEAAARLVRTAGGAGTSIAAVMDAVGLTVGGFYAHFPSKEALLVEAVREAADDGRRRYLPPDRAARDALLAYLSAEHRDHPERGCPLPKIVAETGPERPALQRALTELVEGLAATTGAPCPLARVSLMVGAIGLSRALRGTPLSDAILEESRRFIATHP